MKIHLSFYLYLMSLFFTGTAISRPCFNFFHCLAAKLIKGIIHKLIHEMSSESIKSYQVTNELNRLICCTVKLSYCEKATKFEKKKPISFKVYSVMQACRPWVCRVCHGTPRFWQISLPYFNQGGQIMPT